MKLPNRWLIEYDKYKIENFRGNNGIYDYLTDEQIQAVKLYFRWKTRMQFRRTLKGTRLERKPQKAEALIKIMGDADDWEYDGCVDTGYLGGGHCGLGHALRYEHYAVSPSTGKEVVFGVTCASDFFGIDPGVLRKINSIQEETLDEIKTIVFIKLTGKNNEYVETYYGDMEDVFGAFKGCVNDVFGADWATHMHNFLKCKLPWTKSMVERFEWIKKSAYAERKKELEAQATVAKLVQGDASKVEFIENVKKDSPAYIKAVVSYISYYNGNSRRSTDDKLKWCNALLDLAMRFDRAYNKINSIGVKDIKEFSKSGKRTEIWMHAKNGDRIATKLEIETFSNKQFTKVEYPLGQEVYEYLQLLTWGVTGTKGYYLASNCNDDESVIRKLEYSYKKMYSAVDWVMSEEFRQDVRKLAESYKRQVVYLDGAIDEEPGKLMINHMVDVILDNYKTVKQGSFQEAAVDIAHKFKKGTKLTDKQKNMLSMAYESIKKSEGKNEKTPEDLDILRKAQYVKDNAKGIKNVSVKKKVEFGYKVSVTVLGTKRVSDKQKDYIEKAYEEIRRFNGEGADREQAKQIFVDDNIEKPSNIASLDLEENNTNDVDSEVGYNPDVFDDGAWDPNNYDYGSNFSQESDIFDDTSEYDRDKEKNFVPKETTACFISGVPSIVDISEALGHGVFLTEIEGGKE